KANVAYGEDASRQEETFASILPREQFVDRRLITQELISCLKSPRTSRTCRATLQKRAAYACAV
ncbi:unnamed protein product, partial [Amoebophrya sp. A120]